MAILQYLKDAYDYDTVIIWTGHAACSVYLVNELLRDRNPILLEIPKSQTVIPECGLYNFRMC